jgi:hypothetical protein
MALKDNLVSHWKLDEASGNRADSHGSNTLTDNNTVGSGTGKIGNGADFVAANSEYLSCADTAGLSGGDVDFELGLWVKLDSLATTQKIYLKGNGSGYEFYLDFENVTAQFRATFYASDGFTDGQSVLAANFGAIDAGTWYRVHTWHDSVNNLIGISVNGTINTDNRTTGVFDSDRDVNIGRSPFGEHFDGLIDEVSFWKRIVGTTDRAEIYNAGAGLDFDLWDAGGGGLSIPIAAYHLNHHLGSMS